MKTQTKPDIAPEKPSPYPKQCYCGHVLGRHMYNEGPVGGWQPGDPEPELTFTHCAGMAPHGNEKQVCKCKTFHPFPFGFYRHLKTGNVYEVKGLAFNADDRALEVEYTSAAYEESWHRPLYAKKTAKKRDGFLDPDEDTGRPRFEFIPNPTADDLSNFSSLTSKGLP